jgi:hypothetical protein
MKTALALAIATMLAACGETDPDAPTAGAPGTNVGGEAPSAGGAPGVGGSADGGQGGVHVVEACPTSLGVAGEWERITPPELVGENGLVISEFGIHQVVVDPKDPRVVYLGTDDLGIYKSEDCGATFVHVDTGTLGAEIDTGSTLMALDPVDTNVLYTSSLYGMNGFFRSTNGGVDFEQVLTPEVQQYAPYGGFVGGIAIDPDDHAHVVVSWHAECAAPYESSCFAETLDSGETWVLRNGDPSWLGGEGSSINLLTGNVWLFSSQTNGLWRSTDAGETWAYVDGVEVGHAGGQHYRAGGGAHYLGSVGGVMFTPDDGETWSLLPSSGSSILGLIGNGDDLWASNAFPYNTNAHPDPFKPHVTAKLMNPQAWSIFDSPMLTSGAASMAYDPDHRILYTANYWEGVWRIVVE